jgi:hypothetical protein
MTRESRKNKIHARRAKPNGSASSGLARRTAIEILHSYAAKPRIVDENYRMQLALVSPSQTVAILLIPSVPLPLGRQCASGKALVNQCAPVLRLCASLRLIAITGASSPATRSGS